MQQITQGTKDKAESAKAYIEKKYQKLKNEEKERKEGKLVYLVMVFSLGHAAKQDGYAQSK